MKIKFDSNLDFQREAIDSIVNIFKGQPLSNSKFTVENPLAEMPFAKNRLKLDIDDILKNVQVIQLKNGLNQTEKLVKGNLHFAVEMETGTGKTYVYLRTILELNKKYGFTKFIVVVPSIAIKEGVYKTLQLTKEHFKSLYNNKIYEYFTYDSQKLEQIKNFAESCHIQIMVINIDAFRRSFNIIHRPNDRLNGEKPIELIQRTCPIVIIDEPQSVDTTEKSKTAISSLNPLCTLRYSATHRDRHNLMYKLDAIDAYERQLVKQIEVASVISREYHNNAYIKLLGVDNSKTPITAKLEIDVLDRGKIKRKTVTVKQGDDLFLLSGGRKLYSGYIINDIYCEKGNEYVDFTGQDDVVRIDSVIGEIDDDIIKKSQIKRTIEEHLDKECKLKDQGIKVLSLFFIDKVANYRYYDKDKNPCKGKYALWFEEEYKKLLQKPKYRSLIGGADEKIDVEAVHNGYFAVDRNGLYKDTRGNSLADEDIYNLIMKDKERLLSFDSKLRFIFSHSALKEGWDNPNVFQICTLNETKSEIKKRQEIGRGLRLAVNQKGERVHGFDVNTLTIIANESYEDYAKTLQKEYEEESGISFSASNWNIKNADDKRKIKLNQKSPLAPEFRKIWERIENKTIYSIKFDTDKLINNCLQAVKKNLRVDKPKLIYAKAKLDVRNGGVLANESGKTFTVIEEYTYLPDIITYLQNETNLTRKTIVEILLKSRRLEDFKNNPQQFMTKISRIIKNEIQKIIVHGIKYTKIDNDFYVQQLFENEKLSGTRKFELPSWFKIDTPLGDFSPDWAVLIDKEGLEELYFISGGEEFGEI